MKRKFFIITLFIIWTLITLTSPYIKTLSIDEVHAYDIAQTFGFIDIIRLMKTEGHTFMWYILMKPICFFDKMILIKYLNWIFVFAAMIVMWRYSPFSDVTKTLVMFSFPYLVVYPSYARCYGIGIFFLFILASLFKDRLKHPIIFAIMVFFAANTSLMAVAGAAAFALIFLYDSLIEAYKQKDYSNLSKPILIMALGALSLFIQWYPPKIPVYGKGVTFFETTASFLFDKFHYESMGWIIAVILPVLIGFACVCFKKRALIFLILTLSPLLAFFGIVYSGAEYHMYFFYTYMLIAYWMHLDATTPKKGRLLSSGKSNDICFEIIFIMITVFFMNKNPQELSFLRDDAYLGTPFIRFANVLILDREPIYMEYRQVPHIPYFKDRTKLLDYDGESISAFKNYYYAFDGLLVSDIKGKIYRVPKGGLILIRKEAKKFVEQYDILYEDDKELLFRKN